MLKPHEDKGRGKTRPAKEILDRLARLARACSDEIDMIVREPVVRDGGPSAPED